MSIIIILLLILCLLCYLQVTKLCDLGIDDSVCSVGWAQRGTQLAVGTSNGKVQVINIFIFVELKIFKWSSWIVIVFKLSFLVPIY